MPRVDEISKYYKISGVLDNIANALFYILALLAIVLSFLQQENIKSIASVLFVVLAVAYFIHRYSGMLIFMPHAEKMRRKQLLSDSFALSLVHESTEEYYNNLYAPSVKRLGANILENSLFSQRVLEKMLLHERVKVGLYFTLWVAALVSRNICQDVVIVISQSVFSAEVLARWISMEILRFRYSEVYDGLYKIFLTKQHESTEAMPLILDGFSSYECAKAAASIRLPSKIFFKINPEVTIEWERIKKILGMTQ